MPRHADVVIAVHDEDRPIERAVHSVLQDGLGRAVVVCHGIDPDRIAERLEMPGRVVETGDGPLPNVDVAIHRLVDGIRSPAGPLNHGLDRACAPFVGVMGSDDFLEPGALRAWVQACQAGADVVVGRLRHQNGDLVRAPLARPWRRRQLDLVRDRLAYRTAPLGLLRRSVVEDDHLRFGIGLATGEDLEFGLRLWTSGRRIDYPRTAPAYVIGADSPNRVTGRRRPVHEELAAVEQLLRQDWVFALSPAQRRSVAVKLIRIHLLGAVTRRAETADWSAEDQRVLVLLLDACEQLSPSALDPLSLADRQLLRAVRAASDSSELVEAVRCRRHAGRTSTVRTERWLHLLDREGMLRRYANYKMTR
jgi:hypothetical protein